MLKVNPKRPALKDISYLANFSRGPILLTAPHSCMVKRGGLFEGDKVRQHLREQYTSTIVLGLTHHIEKLMQAPKQKTKVNASYCVWSKEKASEN